MLSIRSEAGIGKITLIVFGSLAAAILYTGYEIMPFFYYYYEIQNQFESAVRVEQEYTDAEIRQKLLYHIKKMQLPVRPEDLKIRRTGYHLEISMEYKEVFEIYWKGKRNVIWEFPFKAYAKSG